MFVHVLNNYFTIVIWSILYTDLSADFSNDCVYTGICLFTEKWLVMVNQVHPRICQNIITNLRLARTRVSQGDPFILVVGISNLIHFELSSSQLNCWYLHYEQWLFHKSPIQARFKPGTYVPSHHNRALYRNALKASEKIHMLLYTMWVKCAACRDSNPGPSTLKAST